MRPIRSRAVGAFHSFARSIVAVGSLGVLSAHAAPKDDGVWSPVASWPLISVHAALTPDGRVLTYGTKSDGTQTGYFIYDVWDPSAGLGGGHMTLNNMTLTDIFCSSQVILPQTGQVFIAGGDNWTGTATTNTGNNNSNLFDYTSNTLARSANMNRARWYSSSTVLVNGDVYVQGGSGGADFPEVRDGLASSFRLLSGASTNSYVAQFPRNFLAPDGRIFGYDTNGNMYFVTTGGTGSLAVAGQINSANVGWTSSAAMYRPGRILQIGGNSNGAVIIDINGPQPTVTSTQSMSSQRQWVSATILPDGRVLATGGSQTENQLVGVNNSAEIWDPTTGQWHVGTSGVPARLYHSGALLLPDATVLVSGGGAPGPQNNTNAEIYSPPYLFNASGGLAPRPRILGAPDTLNVGDSLTIDVDAPNISRVTLIKSGSTTHSVNMDQRFLELPFTSSANQLYAQLPVRASDTPPGFYHLFVLNTAGVPSVSKIIRINVDSTPNTAVDYTPAVGGSGGTAFSLACNTDEVLVGVYGKYSTYVNQIGPQCVQMDQFGHWIGSPVSRALTGTTTSGTAFTKTCARDFAMSGFRGNVGTYVNQLDIQCRALTPAGGLSGTATFLGAVGGSGGTATGSLSCGTDNPVYALYGRSSTQINAFGVQCRTGAITPIATNAAPVVVNPGTQSSIVGVAVDLAIQASDGNGDTLSYSATGLPSGLTIGSATGHVTGVPSAAGTFSTNVTVSDGTTTASAAFTWNVAVAAALSVDPMPPQPSSTVGTAITFTASTHGGVNVRYKWQFGDGTPETSYSPSASVTHTFTAPGVYFATLTVTDDTGAVFVQQFAQTIHLALTPASGRSSTNVAYEPRSGSNSRVWVVNQDNDSVGVVDAVTNSRLAEIAVGTAPRGVAIAPDGRVWVTTKSGSTINVLSPSTLSVAQTITLPAGSQPFGIVFSPAANVAFVVLEGSGTLLKLDGSTGSVLGTLAVGTSPRHVAIDGAGTNVYVSRFITPRQPGEETAVVPIQVSIGGEVVVVNASGMNVVRTIALRHSDKLDAENQGGGVPNYLGAVAISPDGTSAIVPSKQDNIARGTLRSGANITFQNTVRAISSRIDLVGQAEDYAHRIDHDNSSVASAAVYEPNGVYAFVALETSRQVAVVDVYASRELFRFDVGRAPQGLAISPDGTHLFVSNFMDRTLGVFDLTNLQTRAQWNVVQVAAVQSIGTEKLTAAVLTGKQLFYDARDTRLARDAYMSCATCHNDGGQDGRVWDLTGMGEGLRNTINLKGPGAAFGRLHWSANFDEVQDFEGQIRTLGGGTGLMADADFNAGTRSQPLGDPKAGLSADLDALAAYVASLNQFARSPNRNADGTLTTAAAAGRNIFRRENCAACHSGTAFTDSSTNVLHDIGTLKPTSGSRLGGPLTGIDTPTLRGVWQSAPYLHDGSAATLADAVTAHNGVSLTSSDLSTLVAYLGQIDALETSAPLPNTAPSVVNPGAQSATVGQSVSLPIVASDADGDVLTYTATGLPAGLTINSATGLITGKPTTTTTSTVVVTVSDGIASPTTSFGFTVAGDGIAPTTPGVPDTSTSNGKANLLWTASTDNIAVTGYIVYRSTSSTVAGTEIGRTTIASFRDTSVQRGKTYYYSVQAYDAAGNLSARSGVGTYVSR